MKRIESLSKEVKSYLQEHCIDAENAISMQDLANTLECSTRDIRHAIRELRREQLCFGDYVLISNHKDGYWLSKNVEEINLWLKGYMSMALDILKTTQTARKMVKHKMSEEMIHLFNFQLREDLQNKYEHAIIPTGETVEKRRSYNG